MNAGEISPTSVSAEVASARSLLVLRTSEPAAAMAGATALLTRRNLPAAARALALRVSALVTFDGLERSTARRLAVRSVQWARRADDAEVLGGCLTTLAGIEFFAGHRSAALTAINEASEVAPSSDVRYTRAWMSYRAGEWAQAIDAHEELLRDELSDEDRALTMSQYALVLAELGRSDEAVELAHRAATSWVNGSLIAKVTLAYNHAYCLSLAGRIPAALDAFDRLSGDAAADPAELAWVAEGHAGVLARCNLLDEAMDACHRGLRAAGSSGPLELRAELWWRHSQVAMAQGSRAAARASAGRAKRLFDRLGNPGRADLAAAAQIRATAPSKHVLDAACSLAASFADQGRWEPAVDIAVHAVLAHVARRSPVPCEVLDVLRTARSRVTTMSRARAWLGLTAHARSIGDHAAARRGCRQGLAALDQLRQQLGSAEMKVRAAALSDELLRFGLDIPVRAAPAANGSLGRPRRAAATGGTSTGDTGDAAETGDGDQDGWAVFDLVERARSRSLLSRPATSPDVAAALAAVRRLHADPEVGHADLVDAESALRQAARRTFGDGASALRPLSRRELAAALDGRTMLSFNVHDSELWCVRVANGESSLTHVGHVADVFAATAELRFATQRLARSNLGPVMQRSMMAASHRSIAVLSRVLHAVSLDGEPSGSAPEDRLRHTDLIVVAPPALADVPFHALEGWQRRAVTLTPSATWWVRKERRDAARAGRAPGRASAVAIFGPNLAGGRVECERIAELYAHGVVDDTIDGFVSQLASNEVAHIAAHGRLRADHPHLSSVLLRNGPCTLYDLHGAANVADTVVLAACEVAGGSIHPGDEILGFVNELLSLGAGNVVASSAVLSDRAAPIVMEALHRELAAGGSVSSAMSTARRALDQSVPDEWATYLTLAAFGTGD